MPAFQPSAQGGSGFGGDFNFTASNASNPFAQQSNGTPPPTTFQFGGAPSQPQTQQNGGGGIFGNNSTSFGSTLGSGNSQPQQNGFNPSTTSMFGSQSNNANSGSSFTFGQTSQSQQNGTTPSTIASFPTFGDQKENPFKNFGQSQQTQSTPATSFGGFGQNSQPSGDKPQANGTPSLFANNDTPKTTTSSIFSSFGKQPNGDKAPFGSTSQTEETPKANTGSIFGAQQQSRTSTPLFGSTPPPSQGDKTDGSVFLGLDSARSSTVKTGMFTSSQSKTPEPPSNNPFSFGQTNGPASQVQETPKPTSLLSNASKTQQANGEKPSTFGGGPGAEQQTPKPSTGLFNFGQSQQQPPSTPGFKFGQASSQTEDASMTTPGNTPQKPSLFAASSSQTASETPANQGRSMFDRVSKDPPATTQKSSFTPSNSLFSQPASTLDSASAPSQTVSTPGKSLFERAPQDEAPSTAQKQTSFAPSTNLFGKPAESAATTPSAAPWLSHTPAAPKTTITPPTPQRSGTTSSITALEGGHKESQEGTFKTLNEGLLRHLADQDHDADWTRIMQYYVEQAADVRNKSRSIERQSAPAASPTKHASVAPDRGSASNIFESGAPKSVGSSVSNMFSSAATQQTPKTSSLFQTQSPATAPVNNKRSAPFEEDDGDEAERPAPATENRARSNDPVNYPDLPANASATSKLFQAALDKSTPSSNESSSTGFAPSSSSAGFKPSSATGSGMPSFGAPTSGSGGFLASFGKKANAEEEKQREKRKADDYDSDEETEEQWLKRDREEQEAKRRKIAEAAKTGSGFDLSRSVTPVPPPPETPAGAGKSLMDRISRDPPATAPSKSVAASQTPAATGFTFGSKTPAATSTSNIFSGFGKSTTESIDDQDKEREDGDKTWKPETPIKFGGQPTATESTTPAAPPPAFGNLFGSLNKGPAGSSTNHLGVPTSKPSLGFNFGGQPASLSTSRATTPGVTTDGEGASTAGEGEDDEAAQNDPQLEDQSSLHPRERAEHDVLFEISVAKASKFGEKRDAESGEISKGWVEKGKGPLYVLKNKATGNTSVLMKIKPLGRPAMNFSVPEKMRFEIGGASGKLVNGGFVDTLADPKGGVISRWMVQVGKKEDAAELVRVLNEAAGLPVEGEETKE